MLEKRALLTSGDLGSFAPETVVLLSQAPEIWPVQNGELRFSRNFQLENLKKSARLQNRLQWDFQQVESGSHFIENKWSGREDLNLRPP